MRSNSYHSSGCLWASGLIYAVRALKFLLDAEYAIELVASRSTYMVWQSEQNIRILEPAQQEQFWRQQGGRNVNYSVILGAISQYR